MRGFNCPGCRYLQYEPDDLRPWHGYFEHTCEACGGSFECMVEWEPDISPIRSTFKAAPPKDPDAPAPRCPDTADMFTNGL